MMDCEFAIVTFFAAQAALEVDLQISLQMTGGELADALQTIFHLESGTEEPFSHYLRAEYPTALLERSQTLAEAGIHHGSRIIW